MRPPANYERGQTRSATTGPTADLHTAKEGSASCLLEANVTLRPLQYRTQTYLSTIYLCISLFWSWSVIYYYLFWSLLLEMVSTPRPRKHLENSEFLAGQSLPFLLL